jgi:hypothetical protein
MGADFRWMMCGLDDAACAQAAASFDFSADPGVLDDEQRAAYALFRETPEVLLPATVTAINGRARIEAAHARSFASLFALSRYKALPRLLGLGGDKMLKFLSGETSPVEVLFFALGARQAERLPGFLGNMLVRLDDLPQTIRQVGDVLGSIDQTCWERARRIISMCTAGVPSRAHDDEIRELFSALPTALELALQQRKHFVATAFWLG